ncbi:MAG: DUF3300 domain-containing protein [Chromatiales bacterium]|jgi:hypothetical protein
MNYIKWICLSGLLAALLLPGMAFSAEEGSQETAEASEPAADQTEEKQAAGEAEAQGFPPEQIRELLAPVALYPDALLAQVLMAATYPLDVVQAARWIPEHSDLEGEGLANAAAEEPWDPSVQALVFFPSVVEMMNKDLGWTQDLGEAYLGQEEEVLETVQSLRMEAYDAGNLESTEEQEVKVEEETVIVQPADPEVVYVPTYNPSNVYTEPVQSTYYPTVYKETSSYDSGSFFVGALVGGLLTAAIMWDDNDYCCGIWYGGRGYWGRPGYWGSPGYWNNGWRGPVNIDRNVDISTGDININRGNRVGKWEHNPEHRGRINYKNKKTKAKYSGDLRKGTVDRDVARGRVGDKKPGTRDLKKPASRDIKKPAQRDRQQTAKRDVKKPANRDVKKPANRDVKKPANRDVKKPANRDVKKPAKRDVKLDRPKSKPSAKPATRDIKKPASKPATRQVKKPQSRDKSAFKPSKSKQARASSNRGSKSVKRSGGGGGRKAARARR